MLVTKIFDHTVKLTASKWDVLKINNDYYIGSNDTDWEFKRVIIDFENDNIEAPFFLDKEESTVLLYVIINDLTDY